MGFWGTRRPGFAAVHALVGVLVVSGSAALVACSGSAGDNEPTISPESVAESTTTTTLPDGSAPSRTSLVAQSNGKVKVWKEANSADSVTLDSADQGSKLLTFLVIDQRDDGWLEVLLPGGPVGSKGFIRAKDVEMSRHRYRIEVSLSKHEFKLFAGQLEAAKSKVALGPDVPPAGTETFIKELRGPEFMTLYGSPLFGLAGASNSAKDIKAGKDVLAIHPVAVTSLGKTTPTGSIGVDPALMKRMTTSLILPLGTPVDIVE
jgi:hypothetical protein